MSHGTYKLDSQARIHTPKLARHIWMSRGTYVYMSHGTYINELRHIWIKIKWIHPQWELMRWSRIHMRIARHIWMSQWVGAHMIESRHIQTRVSRTCKLTQSHVQRLIDSYNPESHAFINASVKTHQEPHEIYVVSTNSHVREACHVCMRRGRCTNESRHI